MSLVDDPKFIQLKISGRLPTPKGVALQVIKLTQQADASNQAIAHLIGADPALSVRVIKAANVLLATSSRPVVTIADAVMVLGARGLRQLVLGIALIVDYRHGPCKQFDYPHFWTHSLLTGITAKHLAQHTRLASVDEIFVAGLFSHIGQLALATVFTDEYGALLFAAKGQPLSSKYAGQQDKFGFNEAQLSEAILADMNFPKIFQMLVRHCDQPEDAQLVVASREWRLLHLMHFSMLIADLFMSNASVRGQLLVKIRLQAQYLSIALDDLIEIGDACVRDWLEWSVLLGMNNNLNIPPFAQLLQSADEEVAAVVVKSPSIQSLQVLVVEDDPTTLKLLDAMLKSAGHTVMLASNGVEALRMIRQQVPQLIVSDWMMPEMDGLSLCRKLRESDAWRNIYTVILTAQESPERLIQAFEAGADDYLLKPIAPKIFFARLRAAHRVIQMQAELADDREQLQRLANELTEANHRLQQLALTDVLTGLPNRRAAMVRLDQEWSTAQRNRRPFACMVLDVDHFKAINDQYGHPAGDVVLSSMAQALRAAARAQDLVARFGGEEFLVICPDTEVDAAFQCAERLRLQVAAMTVPGVDPAIKLTVSIGVAVSRPEMADLEVLLAGADKCLYAAKQAGRNRTVCFK
ncbi:MAG: diguanylate cyclase [Nitrosomonadales bacterium]